MKKMIWALVAATIVSTSAMAQDNDRRGQGHQPMDKTEMVKQRTNETVSKYGLNDEQAQKLLELNTRFADKMGPMRGQFRGGRHGNRPNMGGNRPNMGGSKPQRHDRDTLSQQGRPQRPSREDMEKRREEMRKNMEEYNDALKGIMTEEQYNAYTTDMQKRMQQGPHRQNQ